MVVVVYLPGVFEARRELTSDRAAVEVDGLVCVVRETHAC